MNIPAIRAMIIPADYITRTHDNKWIINGTYNMAQTIGDEISVTMRLYIRMQFERTGRYAFKLHVADRSVSPNMPPALEVTFETFITEMNQNVHEMAVELPHLRVPAPVPAVQRPTGTAVKNAFLISLICGDDVIASLNFDAVFHGPPAQVRML
jgi:hypothetical protein